MRGRLRRLFSRISVRILAFNALVVFVPVVGVLSLGTYERQMLRSLERSLVQQGRVLAAALEDSGEGLSAGAERVLRGMRQRHDARLRVVDAGGRLLADSSVLGSAPPEREIEARYARGAVGAPGRAGEQADAQETFLYRMASLPVRMWRRYVRPPAPPSEGEEFYSGVRTLSGPEIAAALAGSYGAATRISRGQQSVTLYSAIPVLDRGAVIGAVLVSQSTYRILSDLYALRLDVFRLFLWSVCAAAALSLVVSATITVPVRRLRDRARDILDPRGRLLAGFVPLRSADEIGDLSRSLGELTGRLSKRARLVESFASDVSHEMKNPLASIRSAAELAMATPEDSEERRALLSMVLDDVGRMEKLLAGVREISLLDAGSPAGRGQGDADADAAGIAESVAEAWRLRAAGGAAPVRLVVAARPCRAALAPERLQQVLENLVDNAAGFSPPGGTVRIEALPEAGQVVVRVSDQGPGIPPEHLPRIFDRFFSFRPAEGKGSHSGLGLAIVKAIAEGCGGSVRASNLPESGACIEVRLPRA